MAERRWGRGRRGDDSRPARPTPAPTAPADPREAAREICLQQLAVRPRTRLELSTALRKRGIDDEVSAEVLDRYDEVGLIDDAAFAKAWVASRHHGKGLARRALAGELRRKGVGSDEVGEALDELDPGTEEETARALVARKLRADSRSAPDALFRRLVGMLARKGYPAGLAIRVVKDALTEREELAEFVDGIDPDALADAAAEPDQPEFGRSDFDQTERDGHESDDRGSAGSEFDGSGVRGLDRHGSGGRGLDRRGFGGRGSGGSRFGGRGLDRRDGGSSGR